MSDLSDPLRHAVDHIRGQSPPRDSMQQALDRARQLSSTPPSRGFPRPLLALAAVAALALVSVGVWLSWPADSWADVAKALQGKPWIHAVGKVGDDTHEFWFSPTRDVSATKSPHVVLFYDQRLRVLHTYEPTEKVLYRVPDTFADRQREHRVFLATFQALVNGEDDLKSVFGYGELVDQKRQRMTENGKAWLEWVITVRLSNQADSPLGRLTFRVDPDNHLPRSMTIATVPRTPNEKVESVSMTFDYPEKGPVDVYNLGVPRDAKFIDRVPADDLDRVLAAVKAGRDRLQPYRGVAVEGNPKTWWNGVPTKVWHAGTKWRVDGAMDLAWPKGAPADDADPAAWWRKIADGPGWQFWDICDGKGVYYRAELSEPDVHLRKLPGEVTVGESQAYIRHQNSFPEHFGYPELSVPSELYEATLDAKPKEGPAGTVLLTVLLSKHKGPANDPEGLAVEPVAYKWMRYWLDPTRGHVVVKFEMRTKLPGDEGADNEKESLLIEQVAEKLERSPNGVWYPTLVRQTMWAPDGKSEKAFRFYLDFKAEMPADVFKPPQP